MMQKCDCTIASGERVVLYTEMIGGLIAQDHEIGLTFCNKVSGVLSAHFGSHGRYIPDVVSRTRIK